MATISGGNTTYASYIPDLGDNADIQTALKLYHYGTSGNSISANVNDITGSGFGDATYGIANKLIWIKNQIDSITSGGIFASIVDAKGDLIVATADNTPARLAVGTDGFVLKANASASSGVQWYNLDTTHLNLNPSSQTLVGNLSISKNSAEIILNSSANDSILKIRSIAGEKKSIVFQNGDADINRWEISSNDSSESSTATGSDFIINRYDNSGTLLGNVLTITRSSGDVSITNNISTTNAPTSSSHLTNKQYVDKGMPVGSIVAYAGATPPAGWLICNGQEVSRTTYSNLFAICGTSYGPEVGPSTFKVPDLTDRFIKGAGTGVQRAVKEGTKQVPLVDHNHSASSGNALGTFGHTVNQSDVNLSHGHYLYSAVPYYGMAQANHTHTYSADGESRTTSPCSQNTYDNFYAFRWGDNSYGVTSSLGSHGHSISVDSHDLLHNHTITVNNASNTQTTSNIMEPKHWTMYYIIKATGDIYV